jgi:hypothetical protein
MWTWHTNKHPEELGTPLWLSHFYHVLYEDSYVLCFRGRFSYTSLDRDECPPQYTDTDNMDDLPDLLPPVRVHPAPFLLFYDVDPHGDHLAVKWRRP